MMKQTKRGKLQKAPSPALSPREKSIPKLHRHSIAVILLSATAALFMEVLFSSQLIIEREIYAGRYELKDKIGVEDSAAVVAATTAPAAVATAAPATATTEAEVEAAEPTAATVEAAATTPAALQAEAASATAAPAAQKEHEQLQQARRNQELRRLHQKEEKREQNQQAKSQHKIAGLSCEKYGGPSDKIAAEMVYWQDIPSDATFISPFKNTSPNPKYLTFEPDQDGWNNLRMAMETAVVMAHAMGRILVMPSARDFPHKVENSTKKHFTFSDFYHFESLEMEHAGIDVISFQEFLEREAMTGHLRDKSTNETKFPPGNRTDWNGVDRQPRRVPEIDRWTRTVTEVSTWFYDRCMVGIPSEPGSEGPRRIREYFKQIQENDQGKHWEERAKEYDGRPTSVDAAPYDRLREMVGHRTDVCIYDEDKQNAKVMHFMGDKASGARLFVHFYAFLFFEDWKQDLWTKRFVRDHLRYIDEIQCAAARVVHAMRDIAKANGNPNGDFDTFHIRRGDIISRSKHPDVQAHMIYDRVRDLVIENSTIYIATDEKGKSFFEFFRQHHHVYFLDDFKHLLEGFNANYYGMLDQLVASRGRSFVGYMHSTFSAYINRLRGYHSQKDKTPGYENGSIDSYYYNNRHVKSILKKYRSIYENMHAQEFPVAWRDIDKGIGELAL